MNIVLTDNDIKNLGHLLKCLGNQQFNFLELKTFLENLEQKLNTAPVTGKRTKRKQARKDYYDMIIDKQIHGNNKKVI